jgi:hypothetical protein
VLDFAAYCSAVEISLDPASMSGVTARVLVSAREVLRATSLATVSGQKTSFVQKTTERAVAYDDDPTRRIA